MKCCQALSLYLIFVQLLAGQNIHINKKVEGDSFVMYLVNQSYMPVFAKVKANENVPADSRVYSDFVLPPKGARARIMAIPLVVPGDTIWLKDEDFCDVDVHYGDPVSASPDEHYFYGLPFQKNKAFRLMQGFNGKFSHSDLPSRYALDFAMPQGEKVCAARDGIVVKVKEDSNDGGPSPKYRGRDNHLIVLHEDGTLGYYVHLKYQGVLVEEGQQVQRGEILGLSGNTGYSTRPHLHFVIRKPTAAGPVSIPFRFEEYPEMQLKVGRKLRRRY